MNEPECVACGGAIDFDNCDGDFVDGVMHGYLGSTEAQKCQSCGDWYHHACGGGDICLPCAQEATVV